MINGIDSSFGKPTPALAAQMRAAGYVQWSGYLATRPGVGLAAPWSRADFDVARLCGSVPIGYCSGEDDPVAVRQLAAAWSVRACLDVEDGIRSNGPWVQAWLDASGAGLYGNAPVHAGRTAAFHVLAAYPGGDPGATWSGPRPAAPCAWQWHGTTTLFGVGVDLTHLDDWFLIGGTTLQLTQQFKLALARILFILLRGGEPHSVEEYTVWANAIASDGSNLDSIAAQMLDSPEGVKHLAAVAMAVRLASDPNTTVSLQDALAAKAQLDALTAEIKTDEGRIDHLEAAVTQLTSQVATLTSTAQGNVDAGLVRVDVGAALNAAAAFLMPSTTTKGA